MVASTSSERYDFLDGLRGWASVAVVLCHYFIEVFPYSNSVAKTLAFLIPFNGTVAVYTFFVISGFSLSVSYIKNRNGVGLARMALSRYPRLAIPIFAACAIVFIMMLTGAIPAPDSRLSPLDTALRFEPDFTHLMRFSFFDVFFAFSVPEAFIVPLWSMSIELFGSFIVITLLAVVGRARWRMWLYGAAFAGIGSFAGTYRFFAMYSLFVSGIMLAELYVSGAFRFRWHKPTFAVLFVLAWCAPFLSAHQPSIFYFCAIVGFCASVFYLGPLQRFFGNRVGRFLGRVSFPLYLLHGPVMYSFSMLVVRSLDQAGLDTPIRNVITATISLPVALGAAVLFAPMNEWAIKISRKFARTALDAFRFLMPDHIREIPRVEGPRLTVGGN